MRKLLSVLLVVLLLVTAIACDPDSGAGNDVTFAVSVSPDKVVKAEKTTNVAYVDKVTKWTYTAVKGDDGYTTGETKEETDLKDGDLTLSLGYWTITVNGYTGENLTYTGTRTTAGAITADTMIAVEVKPVEDVAKGDITFYDVFAEALKASADGGTVTLLGDITLTDSIKIDDGKSHVIDLNNHKISKDTKTFIIEHGKVEFKGKGTVEETTEDGYSPILMYGSSESTAKDYTVVTVGKDVTLRGWAGLFINRTDSNNHAYGVVINMYGKVISPAQDGHKPCSGQGVYIQGLIVDTTGNVPEINLIGADITSGLTGIYAAGYAKWNIKDTTIKAATNGITIAAGEVSLENCTITAGTTKGVEESSNGSVTARTSSAIYVRQHTTALKINVTVDKGTYTGYIPFYWDLGENAETIAKDGTGTAKNPDNSKPEDITLLIKDGTFTCTGSNTDKVSVTSSNTKGSFSITGGTFSTDPSKYVAKDYEATQTGNVWTVAEKTTTE